MPNPPSTGPVYSAGPHFKAGRWAVVIVLLPLAVIAAISWIGAEAVVDQARTGLRNAQAARAEVLAARVGLALRHTLDTLATAAQHEWTDPANLPGLSSKTRLTLHDLSAPPADHVRNKAFRQARGVGAAIIPYKAAGASRLLLAAADVPGQASRIAIAALAPSDVKELIKRCEFGKGAVLLDRSLTPVSEAGGVGGLWHRNDSASEGSWLQTERPVEDFPLNVGIRTPLPDFFTLLAAHGDTLIGGTVLCALLATILSTVLILQARRRLAAAEKSREFALQEIEHVQKLSSIGRLAAGVAHEINNPLAIIAEKSGLMKDLVLATPDMPRAERFAKLSDSILQAVDRCRAVTHRLLGFARRMEVRTMELDLNDVLREVLGFLEREALFRNVKLVLELAEDLPPIESDRGQLQQVFMNLLNNAMAAVSDHGRIRLGTTLENDGVRVEVEDNGVGMSREVVAHIFEPFFSTKGEKGTGLGLSITYGIVNKLGGTIKVSSEEGKGTLFTVHLPLRAAQPAQSGVYNTITSN